MLIISDALRLNRWAPHRSVRAKHTTVARLRLEPRAAALAVIENLAGVDRHELNSLMTADGTGDRRLRNHGRAASEGSLDPVVTTDPRGFPTSLCKFASPVVGTGIALCHLFWLFVQWMTARPTPPLSLDWPSASPPTSRWRPFLCGPRRLLHSPTQWRTALARDRPPPDGSELAQSGKLFPEPSRSALSHQ